MTTDEVHQFAELLRERDQLLGVQRHIANSPDSYNIYIKGFRMKLLRFQVEELVETRLKAIEMVLKANGVKV